MNHSASRSNIMKTLSLALFVSAFMAILGVATYFIMIYKEKNLLFGAASYSLLNTLRVFYFTQLTLACIAIKERFKNLNNHLKLLNSDVSSSTTNNFNILDYAKFYHSLCDGLEMVNKTFTQQFVFLIPNLMVNSFYGVDKDVIMLSIIKHLS